MTKKDVQDYLEEYKRECDSNTYDAGYVDALEYVLKHGWLSEMTDEERDKLRNIAKSLAKCTVEGSESEGKRIAREIIELCEIDTILSLEDCLPILQKKTGEKFQVNKTKEELAELIVALCKMDEDPTPHNVENVCEEIVDVELMIAQLKYSFNFGTALEKYRKQKLEKIKRLCHDDSKEPCSGSPR